MKSASVLTDPHLLTYRTITQDPAPTALDWHSVRALLEELGAVTEEPNGNLEVTRNGYSLVLHPARTSSPSESGEITSLRRFLEQSEHPVAPSSVREPHLLLVIDHRQARLFQTEVRGGIPQQVLPHEPDDHFRPAANSLGFSRGKEKPDQNSFFEPVAKALEPAGQIVVFGTGTGMSSEMDQFVAWLKTHHPLVAERIIGTEVIDEHHLTEGQLLAKAREFYVRFRVPQS